MIATLIEQKKINLFNFPVFYIKSLKSYADIINEIIKIMAMPEIQIKVELCVA